MLTTFNVFKIKTKPSEKKLNDETLFPKKENKNDLKINSTYNKILIILVFYFLLYPVCSSFISNKQYHEVNYINKENNRLLSQFAGSSMSSFTISAGLSNESIIQFGCKNNFFSFNLRGKQGDFVIFNNDKPILMTTIKDEMMLFTKYLKSEKEININGSFKIRSILQWILIHEENFSNVPTGWTKNIVTECGGIRMLGGYCQFGGGEVLKTFSNLPAHSMIRIEATYHFIDAWDTEVGFMRINNGKNGEMQYAWIENYSAFSGDNGINVCGGKWPEGKFSAPINVSIPHNDKSIKLGFGSTTEQDPCDESFGVSGIRIYIR